MSKDSSDSCFDECTANCKLLLAGILLGGAVLALAGLLSWQASPPKKADRMLDRARRKINEIEGILADWENP